MPDYEREEKLRLELLNTADEKEHFHPDVELIYILEGQMDVHVETHVTNIMAGDLLLINSGLLHACRSRAGVFYARLSIQLSLFSDIIGNQNVYFLCDSTKSSTKEYEHLSYLIRKLLRDYIDNDYNSHGFAFIASCYEIMDVLMRDFSVSQSEYSQNSESKKFQERIAEINQYIYANYSKQIGIKALSDQMYLSVGYLSRFFKQNYGMNFTDYLNEIRLHYAVDELLYTDNLITKVAYDNGFSSVSAFNNIFKKKFDMTPSAYRATYFHKPEEKISGGNDSLTRRLEKLLDQDQPSSQMLTKNYTLKIPSSVQDCPATLRSWNQTINIGPAEDMLSSEMQEHIIILRSAFSFEYVRFWSPFAKSMLINIDDEQGNYNFSKLDSVLDFLQQQNLKPHIELMSKPYRVQRRAGVPILFREEDTEISLQKWERLLDAFMKHIIARYSQNIVRDWRFELWRSEMELRSDDNIGTYFDFLQRTVQIIKKYNPEIRVGGSGQHIYCPEDRNYKFFHSFLKSFAQTKIKPDFLSFSCYPYVLSASSDVLSEVSHQNSDPEFLLHGIEDIEKTLSGSTLENIPRQITEWNISVSDRNSINDTTFKGAFLVKHYIVTYGKLSAASYFSGSDCNSESFDSSALLHGGNGLITKYGILKPAGFAMDFLNRSYPYFIAKNEHCLVTTDDSDNYGIVCHNCKELNSTYYLTEEDRIDKENINQYFQDTSPITLNFHLEGLKNGWYQIKISRINEQNGSILDLWHEMEYEQDLSAHDISYFRRMCEPNLTIQKKYTDKHLLDFSIEMLANEISFIKISLKSE